MNLTLRLGDCLDRMRDLPDDSIFMIFCDPPYGLEFMGRDWDTFSPDDVPMMTATERSDHMNRSDSHGPWGRRPRPIMPNTYGHRNERCLNCGKWRISSNRCSCDEPKWEYRIREATCRAMLALQAWSECWLSEAHRLLVPGGQLRAFGGTRTFHRQALAMSKSGFTEIRLASWVYGSGFPKGLDIGKSIDKQRGAEREILGVRWNRSPNSLYGGGAGMSLQTLESAPATKEAKAWNGWGTSLKPAWEPVLIGQKP